MHFPPFCELILVLLFSIAMFHCSISNHLFPFLCRLSANILPRKKRTVNVLYLQFLKRHALLFCGCSVLVIPQFVYCRKCWKILSSLCVCVCACVRVCVCDCVCSRSRSRSSSSSRSRSRSSSPGRGGSRRSNSR